MTYQSTLDYILTLILILFLECPLLGPSILDRGLKYPVLRRNTSETFPGGSLNFRELKTVECTSLQHTNVLRQVFQQN